MADVKEIKDIKIVPFTLMSSSISAILTFIIGLITAIFLGIAVAFLPAPFGGLLAGLGVAWQLSLRSLRPLRFRMQDTDCHRAQSL